MSFSLLLSKSVLVPVGGAVTIGASAGGAYYVYTNRTTSSTSTTSDSTQQKTVVSTNTFLARVAKAGTDSTPLTSPLKCTVAPNKEVPCQVFKLNGAQTTNTITKVEKTALTKVAAPTTDFVVGNYVFVELTSETVTFDVIKNKNISLKSNTTELTTLDFDQLLIKSTEDGNKEVYKPLDAVTETYIVSAAAPTTANAQPTITGFRCKYGKGEASDVVDNYDDSCKLFPIPAPEGSKHITALSKITEQSTSVATLAENTFYKLTVNKNKLYNLDFANAATKLTIELTEGSTNKTSVLTLHQQWIGDKFIGKTDLLLAKFVAPQTPSTYTGTDSKCGFVASPTSNSTDEFACQLHTATPTSDSDITAIQITTTVADSTTLTADHIFGIKLTAPKNIADLAVGKTIYLHTKPTSGDAVTHQFEIKTLLSGSITSPHKAFIISQ